MLRDLMHERFVYMVMFRFDGDLDKNGDNVLNTEEILAWIIPSNEEIATDEVRKSEKSVSS